MDLLTHRRRGLHAAALAILALSAVPAVAGATKYADVRVVTPAGKTLGEFRQYTGTTRIETDPHATCFGKGTGGSGNPFRLSGATVLGALDDAAANDRRLRPLSVTDYYLSSYGPGLCGVGGVQANASNYWEIKVDHADSQVGGGQALDGGESVLFYLTSYPPPPELLLDAPANAQPGVAFPVTVSQYSDSGDASPAEGASVTGAPLPTDAAGHTTVTEAAGVHSLKATSGGDIASNVVPVCVADDPASCPAGYQLLILGRAKGDTMAGTPGDDWIEAGGGDDVIDATQGGSDRIACGAGHDRVILAKGDHDDEVAASCERVVRE